MRSAGLARSFTWGLMTARARPIAWGCDVIIKRLFRRKSVWSWKRPSQWAGADDWTLIVAIGGTDWGLTWTRLGGIRVLGPRQVDGSFPAARGPNLYTEAGMKRRILNKALVDAPKHKAAVETDLLAKHHSIVAHCAVTRYDDGEPRRPGWIVLKTLGERWVVEAKDPDAGARLTVSDESLDEALSCMAVLLAADDAPWESDPFLKQQAKPKKKK